MRLYSKFSILGAVIVLTTAFASADTLGSYATGASAGANVNSAMNFAGMSSTNTISSGTNNTSFLNPGSVWEAALPNSTWVGYASTAGPIGTVNPPGNASTPEFYTFTTTFTFGGPWSGTIDVQADDTTEVFLNGTMIIGDGALGTDTHCASGVPNCSMQDIVAFSGAGGLNTLTFVVEQAGVGPTGGTGDPSGLDFDATITPEPSSLMLLGTGLIGMAGAMLRKMRRA